MEGFHAEGYAPIADNHRSQSNEGIPGEFTPTPAEGYPEMQIDPVNQPGHQRPDFDRVPVPVIAFHLVRPETSGDNHETIEDKTAATAQVIKNGLYLLGIEAMEQM